MADDMLKEDEAESDDGGGNALALIPEQEAALKK
jgi:hypothetical protein